MKTMMCLALLLVLTTTMTNLFFTVVTPVEAVGARTRTTTTVSKSASVSDSGTEEESVSATFSESGTNIKTSSVTQSGTNVETRSISLSEPTVSLSGTEALTRATLSGTDDESQTQSVNTSSLSRGTQSESSTDTGTAAQTRSISGPTETVTDTKTRWSLSVTKSRTGTKDESATLTRSATADKSASITITESSTESISESGTEQDSVSGTQTESKTVSSTIDVSQSFSGTVDQTISFTVSPPNTSTMTHSKTGTYDVSASLTVTESKSQSGTDQESASISSSETQSKSGSFTIDESMSFSQTASESQSTTDTGTSSESVTGTDTLTPPPTPTQTFSLTKTASKSITDTATESHTEDDSATVSPTDDRTASYSANTLSPEGTASAVPTISKSKNTETLTPSETSTETGTADETETGASPSLSISDNVTKSVYTPTKTNPTMTESGSPDNSKTLDTDTFSRNLTKSIFTYSESHSADVTMTINTHSISETSTESGTASLSATEVESLSFSVSKSITFSETFTRKSPSFSRSASPTEQDTAASPTRTWGSRTNSDPSPTLSDTMPLTTSPLPPTTTPMPTPTRTLMTECPPNCGKGVCSNTYPFFCVCYASERLGFWAKEKTLEGTCDRCKPGFFSQDCNRQCPGGTCAICGGHGTCAEGVSGNGLCTCFNNTVQGYWTGTSCSACINKVYGDTCTSICDCVRGICDMGRYGTGRCICDNTGYIGTRCEICDPTQRRDCVATLNCPNGCSGHGRCNNVNGDGVCACDPLYGAQDCSNKCPSDPVTNELCYGHGVCSQGNMGTGLCACNYTNFLPGNCSKCINGFWGPTCANPCFPNSSLPCSGHGECNWLDGKCYCHPGYGDNLCSTQCPTSTPGTVCSGHGSCSSLGFCQCHQDTTRGYWEGASCDRCVNRYWGENCTIPCGVWPLGGGGAVCNGFGTCNRTNGNCNCTSNHCGRLCEAIFDPDGVCRSCNASNLYGPDCDQTCLCQNGAECSNGRAGDGSCTCTPGWAGRYCNNTCVGGAGAAACSGHGECNPTTAQCVCDQGFAGPGCSIACPSPNCNGHGTCSDGIIGTGLCSCEADWVYNSTGCDKLCPCKNGGSCIFPTTNCSCVGNFTGPTCERCKDGVAGVACDKVCGGITNGTDCVCEEGFGGPRCDDPCPVSDLGICSGAQRGKCDAVTALCLCEDGYYGPSCRCSDAECMAVNERTVCHNVTGTCICHKSRDPTDPTCNRCKPGYWGPGTATVPACSLACTNCNGKGSCDQVTGLQCTCFTNLKDGYWGGSTCDTCATGYMGSGCDQESVTVTTLSPVFINIPGSVTNIWSSFDDSTQFFYTGSENSRSYIFNMTSSLPQLHKVVTNDMTCDAMAPNGGKWASGVAANVWPHPHISNYWVYVMEGNTTCAGVSKVQMGPKNHTVYLERSTLVGQLTADYIRISLLIPELFAVCFVPERQSNADSWQIGCRRLNDNFSAPLSLGTDFDPISDLLWIPNRQQVLVTGAVQTSCGFAFTDIDKVGLNSWEGNLQSQMTSQDPRVDCRGLDVNVYVKELNAVIFGAMAIQGVFLSGVDFKTQKVIKAEIVSPLQQLRCTALIFHAKTSVGLAAFSNTLIKFRTYYPNGPANTIGIRPYGQQLMGNNLVSIRSFDLFEDQRIVLATRRSYAGVQILRYLLVEVTDVFPPLAESRGGTIVTVTGNSFSSKAPNPVCRFADYTAVRATILNETTITCVVPASQSAEECEINFVEVSLNNFSFTQNKRGIERPSEPGVVSAIPPRVSLGSSQSINVTGRGFKSSPVLRCKFFYSPQLPNSTDFIIVPGTYITPTLVTCHIGTVNTITSAGSGIYISLDGQLFSNQAAPFSVIGPVAGISCAPAELRNGSLPRTTFLNAIVVQTFDSKYNLLGDLDFVNRTARLLVPAEFLVKMTPSYPTALMSNGVAYVKDYSLALPPVGRTFAQIRVDAWACQFSFFITAGRLAALRIKVQPLSAGDLLLPTALLPQTTEVELVDDGGNTISELINIVLNVTLLEVQPNGTNISLPLRRVRIMNETKALGTILARDTGIAAFPPQILPIVFGAFYQIEFSVLDVLPSINISTQIFTPGCPKNKFQVFGESQCRDCPFTQATCNGSSILLAKPGYWRTDPNSLEFYKCPVVASCLAASEFSGCAIGYTGLLCNDCSDGYGKDFSGKCQQCGNVVADVFILFIAILGIFAVFGILTLLYVQNCTADWTASGKIATILQNSMTMLQTLSLLSFIDIAWPKVMFQLLAGLETFLDFRIFNFLSADCFFRRIGIDTSAIFLFYAAMILFAVGIPVMVRPIVRKWPNVFMTPDAVAAREEYLASPQARVMYAAMETITAGKRRLKKMKKMRKKKAAAAAEKAQLDLADELDNNNNNNENGLNKSFVDPPLHINEYQDGEGINNDKEMLGADEEWVEVEYDEEVDEMDKKVNVQYLKQHQPKAIFLNALQVVFFFGIQPALRSAFEVLPCVYITGDDGFQTEVMLNDVRVSCDSGGYITFRVVAITFVILYALVVPFVYGLGSAYYRFRYFDTFYKTYMGFSACGMTDDLWYWIPTILLRKIWLVIIISFLEPPINLYFFVWSMMAFAWFAYSRKPYKHEKHIFLENVCNLNVIITGNLAMTIHVLGNPEGVSVNILQGVALIINAAVVILLAGEMVRQLLMKTVFNTKKHKNLSDIQLGAEGYDEQELEKRLEKEFRNSGGGDSLEGDDGVFDAIDIVSGLNSSRNGAGGGGRSKSRDRDSNSRENNNSLERKGSVRGLEGSKSVTFVPKNKNAASPPRFIGDDDPEEQENENVDASKDFIEQFANADKNSEKSSKSSKSGNRLAFKAWYEPPRERTKQTGALGALDDWFGGADEYDQQNEDMNNTIRAVNSLDVTAILNQGVGAGGDNNNNDDDLILSRSMNSQQTSSASPDNNNNKKKTSTTATAVQAIDTSTGAADEDLIISEEELTTVLRDASTSLAQERQKMKSMLERKNALLSAAPSTSAPSSSGGVQQQQQQQQQSSSSKNPQSKKQQQHDALLQKQLEEQRAHEEYERNLAEIRANQKRVEAIHTNTSSSPKENIARGTGFLTVRRLDTETGNEEVVTAENSIVVKQAQENEERRRREQLEAEQSAFYGGTGGGVSVSPSQFGANAEEFTSAVDPVTGQIRTSYTKAKEKKDNYTLGSVDASAFAW